MAEPREIYNLIQQSILKLQQLKLLVLSYNQSNDYSRIKSSIADIDRVIEHGNHYIQEVSMFDANYFRFHYAIVSLVDTMRDNDFGLLLTENDKNERLILCSELPLLVEQLIVVNNKLKDD